MLIREACLEDAGPMSLLLSCLAEKYILPNCTEDGGKSLLDSMTVDSISQNFNKGHQYHVVEEHGCIIGVVGIKNNAHLYHLFVSDTHQGKGLSRKLWEHAKYACIQKGHRGFFTVNSAINAKDVYLKLGFMPTGEVNEKSGISYIPMQMND